jgi:hypothetical protein
MKLKKGIYRHFKGNLYEVLETARHSETEEWFVVYRALYGDRGVWIRPLANFCESVERDGVSSPRFACVDDPAALST